MQLPDLYPDEFDFFLSVPPWLRKCRHPLYGIQLSRRLQVSLLCQPINPPSPMAAAVRLRGELMNLGYHVFLLSSNRMMIASPDRPNRFQEYHLDQAQRLLEKLYE